MQGSDDHFELIGFRELGGGDARDDIEHLLVNGRVAVLEAHAVAGHGGVRRLAAAAVLGISS